MDQPTARSQIMYSVAMLCAQVPALTFGLWTVRKFRGGDLRNMDGMTYWDYLIAYGIGDVSLIAGGALYGAWYGWFVASRA